MSGAPRCGWLLVLIAAGCGDNLGARPADAADAAVIDAADAAVIDATDAAATDAAIDASDAAVTDAGDAGAGDASDAGDAAALDAMSDAGDAAAIDADGDAMSDAGDAMEDAGVDGASDADDGGGCTTVTAAHPLAAGIHVPLCSQVVYDTNPPTSGMHYPTWAKYKTYTGRVGRPFWVHDLEHGAVVVSYHCTTPCDAEVAALTAFLAARPADPLCTAAVRNRFVVTPDPELDVRFAASAWGFSLRSSCFDLAALGAFIDAHYAHAPENTCADGVDVLDPASGFPPNCP